MKNVFRIFVLVGIISLGFTACNNDNEGYGLNNRYYSFGTVEAVNGDIKDGFRIRLDNGSWLEINNVLAVLNRRDLQDQDRIVAVYTLIGDLSNYEGNRRYIAILNGYNKILSKEPVLESFIREDEEHRQDSIGNDPIRVDRAWFGGKYLNVEFSVARKRGTNVRHMINLVADDVNFDNDTMNVYLRHNAFGDVPEPGASNFGYATSLVSFDMTELVPANQSSLKVKLHWTQYSSSTDWSTTFDGEKSGTYRPYGKSDDEPKTEEVDYTSDNNVD